MFLTGISSYFSATTGITRVTKDFLGFKAEELQKQAESQWSLLVKNNLTGNPEMVAATHAAVQGYASSHHQEPLGADPRRRRGRHGGDGDLRFRLAGRGEGSHGCAREVAEQRAVHSPDCGQGQGGKGFWFDPFYWYVVVSEERAAFYSQVNQITYRTGVILAAAIGTGSSSCFSLPAISPGRSRAWWRP